MTDALALDGLLRRALLAYNARALHTGAEAEVHAAVFLNEVAAHVLDAMDASSDHAEREMLAEAYRCLSVAADNPLGQSCREREEVLNIACHGLAHAILQHNSQKRATEEEVHELLAEWWTASLLAWSQIFPARLDTVSPPCTCGALGTRPALLSAGS
ncbi:hypothetical protein [Streptomyces sp. NPDC127066]|uniref:hypothetical protein n=1 Tax=Streptomyces sp. NPDC127066 TaxID=3347125 RepID=UPI00366898F7